MNKLNQDKKRDSDFCPCGHSEDEHNQYCACEHKGCNCGWIEG